MPGHERGVVRDEIIAFLERNGPSTVADIYAGVSERLGDDALPRTSVRTYLRNNELSKFRRLERGTYELRSDRPVQAAPKTSRTKRSLTDRELEWAKNEYVKGRSLSSIAGDLDAPGPSLGILLKERGLVLRRPGRPSKPTP